MALPLRMRLSLVGRMVVALAVLVAVSLVVGLTAVLVGGLLVWLALVLAVAAFELTVLTLVLDDQFALLGTVVANPLPIVVATGIVVLPILYLRPVRREIRQFRAELRTSGERATDRHPELATMARRLAQQMAIPEPAVCIANRRQPASYAIGGRSNGTIVLTRGLVRQLADEELRAVLAHEISHLANGDSRVMHLALVPLLVAEHLGSDDRPRWMNRGVSLPLAYLAHLGLWALLTAVTRVQGLCCRLGIAVLSRGREFAADRSAALLTGNPGALASALRTLDDERGTPGEDLRSWSHSASALDILPQGEPRSSLGLFHTHPSTEARIERLERLVEEL